MAELATLLSHVLSLAFLHHGSLKNHHGVLIHDVQAEKRVGINTDRRRVLGSKHLTGNAKHLLPQVQRSCTTVHSPSMNSEETQQQTQSYAIRTCFYVQLVLYKYLFSLVSLPTLPSYFSSLTISRNVF